MSENKQAQIGKDQMPFDDAESTDVSKAGDMQTPDARKTKGGLR